jgi:oligogalacturonide lyase
MKGEVFPAEWREIQDPVSGVTKKQLTHHKAHSYHFYFTNPGWYDNGCKLLFGSDRGNETNLYSIDLQSGAITQLTDSASSITVLGSPSIGHASVNHTKAEAYYWRDQDLIALDINSLEEKIIYRMADGLNCNHTNITADGKYLCTSNFEKLNPGEGMQNMWEARPRSQILKIAVDGSSNEVVWEEQCWISHVNTSPTLPNIISFCHEGPWAKVDQRIWGCDINTGEAWKVRPTEVGDRVGHEYWLADGETIGYHGTLGGKPLFGFARWDNSEVVEAALSAHSMHFHSNTRDLIVGDSTRQKPYILFWRWNGETFEEPRIACEHKGSAHIQATHIHPRFSPDGKQLLFTSDRTGYGSPYLLDVPPYDALPLLSSLDNSA